MADIEDLDAIAMRFATADAVVAGQPARLVQPFYVAPTNQAELNTLRPSLVPVACWRLNHALFDFDSSFVKPAVRETSSQFAALVSQNPAALASVFGHADPVGNDGYNKTLSGRRARAVYSLLVRDVDAWEELHATPMGGDNWGDMPTRTALFTLQNPDSPVGATYLAAAIKGPQTFEVTTAIRAFQAHNGLTADGIAGPKTRRVLFAHYMDAICVDASNAPFVMARQQFVGHGADAEGKGAYQGCSEHNPVLLFSLAAQAHYDAGLDHHERDARNATNRRAMVFLFRSAVPIEASAWPCPRASEGPEACRSMFWQDGDQRRSPGAEEREYRIDRKTMACSFYDRFARRSPCEGVSRPVAPLVLTLYVGVDHPETETTVVILDGAGAAVQTLLVSDLPRTAEGYCVLELDPRALPDPVEIQWQRRFTTDTLLERCSPRRLSGVLVEEDYPTAAAMASGAGRA